MEKLTPSTTSAPRKQQLSIKEALRQFNEALQTYQQATSKIAAEQKKIACAICRCKHPGHSLTKQLEHGGKMPQAPTCSLPSGHLADCPWLNRREIFRQPD